MMRNVLGSIVITLAAAAAGGITAQQQLEGPAVTVYRTFMGPEFTVVQGMFRVDPVQLAAENCDYLASVVVRDPRGQVLRTDSWEGTCPHVAGAHAPALETFQFGLRPAEYTVEVSVAPKARPAEKHVTSVKVQAFAAPPLASDLILAREVGFVDSTDSRRWTMNRGKIGLRVASEMVVEDSAPNLSYYLELYPREGEPMNGSVTGIVRRADGKDLATFPLTTLQGVTEPQPIAASLSVAGLPAGAYTFDVKVQLADTTIVRSHTFHMLGSAAAAPGGVAGYWAALSDQELARFDAVVVWLNNKDEIETYRSLSPVGKRQFLAQQFGNVAPTPDDDDDSALDTFLERVEFINLRFAERVGRGQQAAWETDRGRIYMLRGEPSSKAVKPNPASGSPYELWYYTTENRWVYLFADETRMGNYRLIYTNDPNQQGVSDWDRRVGPEAVEDMQRLGIPLPRIGGNGDTGQQ